MKPNDHLRTLDNLRSLMAVEAKMNLPSHQQAQGSFQQIAERLIEADEMEKRQEEADTDNPVDDGKIVELNPPE